MLLEMHEANRLVEATRWIVLGDAETEGSVSLIDADFDEIDEEPSADSLAPAPRDGRDRQFGNVLRDEAKAVARLREGAIPGRSTGLSRSATSPKPAARYTTSFTS